MFADNTSILVSSPNKYDCQINVTAAFNCVNEWLNANLLSINFNKHHYIQFTVNNKPKTKTKITNDNKQITTISNITFLGILVYIYDTINWKYHIEHILPKLSAVSYVMRSIRPYMSLNTLRIVYYSNFQVRHSHCVDRITSMGKMQSNTTCNICIAKRFFYIACLNNDMFQPLYWP